MASATRASPIAPSVTANPAPLGLAGGDFGMGNGRHTAGGYLGLLTGIAALYASFAEVTNATFKRDVIPMGMPLVR